MTRSCKFRTVTNQFLSKAHMSLILWDLIYSDKFCELCTRIVLNHMCAAEKLQQMFLFYEQLFTRISCKVKCKIRENVKTDLQKHDSYNVLYFLTLTSCCQALLAYTNWLENCNTTVFRTKVSFKTVFFLRTKLFFEFHMAGMLANFSFHHSQRKTY